MTNARWIILAVAMSAVVAPSGCSEQSAGSPMPDESVTTSSESDATEPTASTEPSSERPREIKLDGKDPCTLIPQSDWPKFHVERPGKPSEEPNLKSPNCFYPGIDAGFDITLVVTEGIDAWTDGNRNVEIEKVEPIEGFPTATMANKVDLRACYAAVDVADGQYLLTTATPDPDDPDQPEKCDLAYQLAVSAMKTLVAS